jgi:hypothetical protein
MGWELEDVEKPFVAQLQALGWTHIEGSIDDPAVTGRTGFAEVIQEGLLREQLKDVTVELVDLLVQELQSNRDIWSPHKRAGQEDLNTQLFEHLMSIRPPLVDIDKAGVLADRLMEQARASHDKLVQV